MHQRDGEAAAVRPPVPGSGSVVPASAQTYAAITQAIHEEVSRVIVGKPQPIGMALLTLLAEGHLLIEDVPGVGKTTLAKALSRSVDCTMRRIQFTPDLLPSDVTGSSVFDLQSRSFEFRPGPVFANLVVADEINRSSPKTQAALLECMQESQVTVDGQTRVLASPFMVIATQNPIEMAGTYPLPEPQRDRFLARISLGYPDPTAEAAMLDQHGSRNPVDDVRPVTDTAGLLSLIARTRLVSLVPAVRDYAVALCGATRTHPAVALGASPRAGLHLVRAARARAALSGRDFVTPDDLQAMAAPVLAHRLVLSGDAALTPGRDIEIVTEVVRSLPVPVPGSP